MPHSAHAQLASDPIAPDKKRLAFPLETTSPSYLGAPGAARVTYSSVGPLRHGTVSGGARDLSDTRGDLRLRLQPFWVWLPKSTVSVVKVALDADLRWGPLTDSTYVGESHDPLDDRRPSDSSARLTQAYVTAAGEHFGVVAGLIPPSFRCWARRKCWARCADSRGSTLSYGVSDANDRNVRFAVAAMPLGLKTTNGKKIPKLAITVGMGSGHL